MHLERGKYLIAFRFACTEIKHKDLASEWGLIAGQLDLGLYFCCVQLLVILPCFVPLSLKNLHNVKLLQNHSLFLTSDPFQWSEATH